MILSGGRKLFKKRANISLQGVSLSYLECVPESGAKSGLNFGFGCGPRFGQFFFFRNIIPEVFALP